MEDLLELQKEIKIKIEVYEEITQSDYCDVPMVTYLQGKIEALEEINKKINSIFCNSR